MNEYLKILKANLLIHCGIDLEWDIDSEEIALQEDTSWGQSRQPSIEQQQDKIKRLTNPVPGWDSEPFYKELEKLLRTFLEKTNLGRVDINKRSLIENNIENFKKLYQYTKGSEYRIIGSGGYGAAFDIGNNRILKLYEKNKEKTEYPTYNSLHNKEDIPGIQGELYIIAKGELGTISYNVGATELKTDLHWAVMEKVILPMHLPDHALITNILYGIIANINASSYTKYERGKGRFLDIMNSGSDFNKAKAILSTPEGKQKFDSIFNEIYNYILKSYQRDLIQLQSNVDLGLFAEDWLPALIKTIMIRYLTGNIDLSDVNMGLRPSSGYFVFFDD